MKNKKLLASLTLVALMTTGATMGTFAKYTKEVTTGHNTISAAKFVLKGDKLDDLAQDITIPKVAPGEKGEYEFTVKNNDGTNTTEVPMEYSVFLTQDHAIPNIKFSLYKATEATENGNPYQTYELVGSNLNDNDKITKTFKSNVNEMDRYKLQWNWVENDQTDINYQGKTTAFRIHVLGNQIVENTEYVKLYIKPGTFDTTSTDQTIRFTLENVKMTTSGDTVTLFNVKGIYNSKDVDLGNIVINKANKTITYGDGNTYPLNVMNLDPTNGYMHVDNSGKYNSSTAIQRIELNIYTSNK